MAPGLRERNSNSLSDELVKRDSTRSDLSEFEIMSFRPAEDLDKSGTGRPMSTDSLTLHMAPEKGESGGSEESVVTPSNKQQVLEPQEDPSLRKHSAVSYPTNRDTPVNEQSEATTTTGEVQGGGKSASSPKTVPAISEEPASKPGHPPSGVMAQPGNGSSVQPNRFRRVNQYERGRWTIRDSLVTEEHADGVPPNHRHSLSQSEASNSRQQPLPKHQDSSESNGTPPLKPAQQRSDWTITGAPSLEPLHSNDSIPLSGITGGGLAPGESASDKDSSSAHMDRSSTAAETLSRNTSFSSIVAATEKSVDGDEFLRDIDTDSIMSGVTGAQNLSHDQEVADVTLVSPQPPFVPTSSTGAVPPPASTLIPREEQQQPTPASSAPSTGTTPSLEYVDVRRVEHAMSFLQKELNQVLTSSSYPMLMEENRVLKDQRTVMDQANVQLKTELTLTKEELQATREENNRLKKELKELRHSLTRLAQPTPETAPQGDGGTSLVAPQSGALDDVLAPILPSSDDASNCSTDLIT